MRHVLRSLAVPLAVLTLAGCVDRSYVVETNPPGAFVLVNNQPLGASPADGQFTYYGKYRFTLIKDGYETVHVDQDIPTPWYQYWPVDFFVENLWPWKVEDRHRFRYDLTPMQVPNTADILRRSEGLRAQGQRIREQQPPAPAAPEGLPAPGGTPAPVGSAVPAPPAAGMPAPPPAVAPAPPPPAAMPSVPGP